MAPKITETTAFRVKAFEPNRWMLWSKPDSTWAWDLRALDGGRTRLVSRIKVKYDWSQPSVVGAVLLMELGDFPMSRRELIAIKARVERTARGEASGLEPLS